VARDRAKRPGRLALLALGVALCGVVIAVVSAPANAVSAAGQDWPPFVLVTGLLLVGLVANDDGLFEAAGNRLARLSTNGLVLFMGAALLIGSVTAVLNLDTSVAFLTPVLVYAARSRGGGEAPLLYGCLMLSNAGSLFLPGSNLTNLIVLGHTRLTGAGFIAHMWAPASVALLVSAAVIAVLERRQLRLGSTDVVAVAAPRLGLGLFAVVSSALLVVAIASPALPVMLVGAFVVGRRLLQRRTTIAHVAQVLGIPVLAGLFASAVALGTLGRAWSSPSTLLVHLTIWGTSALAALAALAMNNLPAASLLSARAPTHPYALIIGLNLGPNLCVSGSLAWLLWLRAARTAGAQPSLVKASRIGAWVVPLSMVSAVATLQLWG